MPAAVAAGTSLHHLALKSANPDALAAFYGATMQMPAARQGAHVGGGWLCRAATDSF